MLGAVRTSLVEAHPVMEREEADGVPFIVIGISTAGERLGARGSTRRGYGRQAKDVSSRRGTFRHVWPLHPCCKITPFT